MWRPWAKGTFTLNWVVFPRDALTSTLRVFTMNTLWTLLVVTGSLSPAALAFSRPRRQRVTDGSPVTLNSSFRYSDTRGGRRHAEGRERSGAHVPPVEHPLSNEGDAYGPATGHRRLEGSAAADKERPSSAFEGILSAPTGANAHGGQLPPGVGRPQPKHASNHGTQTTLTRSSLKSSSMSPSSGLSGRSSSRERNWCAYVRTRLAPKVVSTGSESFAAEFIEPCPRGFTECNTNTVLKQTIVTSLEWKCCPGYIGADCKLKRQKSNSKLQASERPAGQQGDNKLGLLPQQEINTRLDNHDRWLRELQKDMNNVSAATQDVKGKFDDLEERMSPHEGIPREPPEEMINKLVQKALSAHLGTLWSMMEDQVHQLSARITSLSRDVASTRRTIRTMDERVTVMALEKARCCERVYTQVESNAASISSLGVQVSQLRDLNSTLLNVKHRLDTSLAKLALKPTPEHLGNETSDHYGTFQPGLVHITVSRKEFEGVNKLLDNHTAQLMGLSQQFDSFAMDAESTKNLLFEQTSLLNLTEDLLTSSIDRVEEKFEKQMNETQREVSDMNRSIRENLFECREKFQHVMDIVHNISEDELKQNDMRGRKYLTTESIYVEPDGRGDTEESSTDLDCAQLQLEIDDLRELHANKLNHLESQIAKEKQLFTENKVEVEENFTRIFNVMIRVIEKQKENMNDHAIIQDNFQQLYRTVEQIVAEQSKSNLQIGILNDSFSALLEDAVRHSIALENLGISLDIDDDDELPETNVNLINLQEKVDGVMKVLLDHTMHFKDFQSVLNELQQDISNLDIHNAAQRLSDLENAVGLLDPSQISQTHSFSQEVDGNDTTDARLSRLKGLRGNLDMLRRSVTESLERLHSCCLSDGINLAELRQEMARNVSELKRTMGELVVAQRATPHNIQALVKKTFQKWRRKKTQKKQRSTKSSQQKQARKPSHRTIRDVSTLNKCHRLQDQVAFFWGLSHVTNSSNMVPFDLLFTNHGFKKPPRVGVFSAPCHGVYAFHFTLTVQGGFSTWRELRAALVVNGHDRVVSKPGIGTAHAWTPRTTQHLSAFALLELKAGQQVWVCLHAGKLCTGHPSLSTFAGFLLVGR
uniref:multimerin-2 isoform X2 n=1 Tax=Myxine glutinosa TaxID=7769 RepID=UPI00358E2BEA